MYIIMLSVKKGDAFLSFHSLYLSFIFFFFITLAITSSRKFTKMMIGDTLVSFLISGGNLHYPIIKYIFYSF